MITVSDLCNKCFCDARSGLSEDDCADPRDFRRSGSPVMPKFSEVHSQEDSSERLSLSRDPNPKES